MIRKVIRTMALFLLLCAGCSSPPSNGTLSGFYISAWFASYDSTHAYNSLSEQIGSITEINPVWYNLNSAYFTNGAAPFVVNPCKQAEITDLSAKSGVKLLPTIQNFGTVNFDSSVIGAILADPQLRVRHVGEITDLVTTGRYDGIDLDYENLPGSARDSFTVFCMELGQALHAIGKEFSLTVYAKTSSGADWNGPGAQDWNALVTCVDTFKVMVYDYHWAAFHAGPIAPVDWLRAVLDYARTVPGIAGKLLVGMPFYGIDWPKDKPGREVTFTDAQQLMGQYAVSNCNRDDADHSTDPICGAFHDNVEPHFTYNDAGGTSHTVYFQDAVALEDRLKILSEYQDIVKGVAFWRLGGEDTQSWMKLQEYQ